MGIPATNFSKGTSLGSFMCPKDAGILKILQIVNHYPCPSFPCFLGEFLAFSPCEEFLGFFERFPLFSRDFRSSVLVVFTATFQKNKEGQAWR